MLGQLFDEFSVINELFFLLSLRYDNLIDTKFERCIMLFLAIDEFPFDFLIDVIKSLVVYSYISFST